MFGLRSIASNDYITALVRGFNFEEELDSPRDCLLCEKALLFLFSFFLLTKSNNLMFSWKGIKYSFR